MMTINQCAARCETFSVSLKLAIQRQIAALRAEGTCGMSADNLYGILRIPPGGPSGTNCGWVLRQMVDDAIASLPRADRSFIR